MKTNPVWLIRDGAAVRIQPTMSSPPGVLITSFEELLFFIDECEAQATATAARIASAPRTKPKKLSLDDLNFF
jgi:hypothetical protein